jgi:hypothetical protein
MKHCFWFMLLLTPSILAQDTVTFTPTGKGPFL